MPLFTWDPIPGAESYYVLVARDPSFTNVVDYAYTRIPAYAPRLSARRSLRRRDDPLLLGRAPRRQRQRQRRLGGAPLERPAELHEAVHASDPAEPDRRRRSSPRRRRSSSGRRSSAQGATGSRSRRRPTFSGTPLDDVVTDSTAFTSNTTYPADTTLYWRVRAEAENGSRLGRADMVGRGTFRSSCPSRCSMRATPTNGAFLPTVRWIACAGRESPTTCTLVEPDGDTEDVHPGIPCRRPRPSRR